MANSTTPGTIVSFGNTPQAQDDLFTIGMTGLTEDTKQVVYLNVMGNDLGGNAKTLYSLDNGTSDGGIRPVDLLVQDIARVEATSDDVSALGAKIWINSDGTVGYDLKTIQDSLQHLAAGELATDSFTYAIRLGNGTLSWATARIQIAGTNDAPVIVAGSTTATGTIGEASGQTGSTATDAAFGTIAFTDVDLNDTHVVTQGAAAFSWSGGTLTAGQISTLTSAGTLALTQSDSTHSGSGSIGWNYSAVDQTFDFLAAGEKLTVTYNVTVTDNRGLSAVQPVTITVTGTNDVPVLAADASGLHAITEAAGATGSLAMDSTAAGTLAFTDVDLTNTHSVTNSLVSTAWSGGSTLPAELSTALGTALATNVAHDSTGTGAGSVGFTFSAADNKFDFLAAGETLTVTYNVTVKDSSNGTSTKPVTITITGTNDAPVITAQDLVGAVTEQVTAAGNLTDSGVITFTDVDLTDVHLVSATGTAVGAGVLGSLTAAKDHDTTGTGAGGQLTWTYTVADAAVEYLAAGQTKVESFTITLDDQHGGLITKQIDVTITGTNDAPVVAADASGPHAITEAAGVIGSVTADTAAGTLAFTDVDLSNTHTVTAALNGATWSGGSTLPDGLADTLGAALTTSVAHDSTGSGAGSVGFTFRAADSKFDFLAAGETLTVTYNVTVKDSSDAVSTKPVTITVTGTNDAPVVAADAVASHAVSEIAGATGSATADTATGTLAFTDVDLSNTHTVTAVVGNTVWSGGSTLPAGLSATLANSLSTTVTDSTGTGAGSVGFSFSAADNKFDFLAAGETLTVTYNVTVKDSSDAVSTQPVTITVTGTNDAPVVAADAVASHAVSEIAGATGSATADTATGTLAFTDVDLTNTHTVSAALNGATWSGGSTLPAGLSATLASSLSTTVTDSTGTGAGSVGFSFSAADNKFDFLAAGETLTVTYNVTVKDSSDAVSTQPVTITVTGTNDAPVVAADAVASHAVSEIAGATGSATADTATGTLAFTDVDLTNTHTVSAALNGATWSGGSTLPAGLSATLASSLSTTVTDSTGTGAGSVGFSFSAADNKFDFLAAGETLTVTYNVTVKDSSDAVSTQPVTITVTGTNDAPVVAADAVASHAVSEIAGATGSATADTATGTLAFTDVDLTNTHTVSAALNGATWSGGSTLPAGLSATLASSLSTTVTDSTGTGAGSVGFSFSAADNKFDFLAAGETLTVTYNVTVKDSSDAVSTQPVTITVTGTNDVPVLSADTGTHAIIEAANTTGSSAMDSTAAGTLAFTDVDLTNTHTVSAALNGATWSGGSTLPAGLSATLANSLSTTVTDSTGTGAGSVGFSFSAADNKFDFLAAGETLTVTYNVTVKDSSDAVSTQPVTITVTGTNDVPVLSADTGTHAIIEAANTTGSSAMDSTAAGTLAFTDVDLTNTHTVSAALNGATWSGGSTLPAGLSATLASSLSTTVTDSTGTGAGSVGFSFSAADNKFDFLAAGETLTVTYNVTVKDSSDAVSTQPVTITVTGTNDVPVLSADTGTHAIIEAANTTGSSAMDSTAAGTLAFTDVDLTNTHTVSAALNGATWSGGSTLPAGLSATLASSLSTTVTDSTGTGAGSVGFSFSAADNKFDFLAAGETLTVTYNVTVKDSSDAVSTQPVTITVTGTNDVPVLSADTGTHAIIEAANTTGSSAMDSTAAGTLAFTDVDLTNTHTVSAALNGATWSGGSTLPAGLSATLASSLSTTVTDSTGTGAGSVGFSFSAADNKFDFLAAGETLTVTYNVTVKDSSDAVSTQPVTITVTGTNDVPVLSADTGTHAIIEAANTTGSSAMDSTAAGTLAFTDVDLTNTHTVSAALNGATWSGGSTLPAGLSATLASSLSTTVTDSTGTGAGSVGFSFSAADNKFDFLAAGETLTVTYNVTVKDSSDAVSTQPVTITVTGTNDVPVLSADTGTHAIIEAANTTGSSAMDSTAAGTLAFTDVDLTNTHTVSAALNGATWSGGSTLPAGLSATLANSLSTTVTDSTGTGAGSVGFSFSAADNKFDFLAAGETLTVTYNVTVKDSSDAVSTQPVTITVTGTNDAPVVAADTVVSHAVSEIAGATGSATADTATGTLAFTDVDLSNTHTVTTAVDHTVWSGGSTLPAGLADTLGAALTTTLTDSAGTGAGSVGFSFNAADSKFDFLAEGETLTVTYNVTVTDSSNAASTKPVTITVTGTNDAPVVAADAVASHAVSEIAGATGSATADTATGTLAFTDVDLSNTHTVTAVVGNTVWSGGSTLPAGLSATLANSLSTTVTDSTGTGAGSVGFSFSAADNKFDFLAAGETLTVTYNVTVKDSSDAVSTQPVTITVTGTNDVPVLSADTGTHAIIEAANTTGSSAMDSTAAGTLAFTDVDLTNTHTVSAALNGATWSGGSTLPAGLSATLASSLSTTVTDSTGTGAGSVGFSFSAADNKFDFLAAGETLTVTYNVTVKDSSDAVSTQPVTITVTGTNDVPVLSADTGTHAIIEAANTTGSSAMDSTAAGTLAFTDVDLTNTHTVSAALNGATWSGGSTLPAGLSATLASSLSTTVTDSTGTGAGSVGFSFSAADNKFDFLAAGETLTVTYNVTVKDSSDAVSTQPVTITVTGTNDVPVLSADTGTHAIIEAANTTGSSAMDSTAAGTLAFTDVDLTNTHTVSAALNGATWSGGSTLPAGLSATLASSLSTTVTDSTGTGAGSVGFSFSAADNKFDFLAAGETLTVTYNVTVKDSSDAVSTQPVTITVTGTNDAPVVAADAVASHAVSEIAGATGSATADTATGTLAFTDVDLSNTHTVTTAVDHTVWSGGSTLPAGLADTLGAALTTTLTDSAGTGAGSVGFSFNAADSKFDFLAEGETLTVTYNVTVTDSSNAASTKPVTITVTGTNDAPVINSTAVNQTIAETNAALTSSGAITFTDLDHNAVDTAAVTGTPVVTASTGLILTPAQTAAFQNAFTVGADGHWNFNLASPDYLAQGESVKVAYTVTVTDDKGATASQVQTITVTGTNDAPVINSTAVNQTIAETNAALTSSGAITFTDLDHNAVDTAAVTGTPVVTASTGLILTPAQTAAFQNAFTVGADGHWNFNLASPDYLAQGESVKVDYTVTVTDDKGATASQVQTITVTGTNDAPVINSTAVNQTIAETNAALTSSGAITFTDLDHNAVDTAAVTGTPVVTASTGLILTPAQTAAFQNAFTVGADGHWNFNLASPDYLAQGESVKVAYTVTVTDDKGATASQVQTITVTGTNDAPVINSTAVNQTIAETNAALTSSGAITFTDLDHNAVDTAAVTGTPVVTASTGLILTPAQTAAFQNAFTVGADGHWNFNLASPDYLAQGESVKVDYTVTVTDDKGATASQVQTITVTGTNDAPVGDTQAPTVTSITGTSSKDQTAGTATFTVTFSENVSNVTKDDFTLFGTSTTSTPLPNITGVSGSGNVYTVTASYISAPPAQNGDRGASLGINLNANTDVMDAAHNKAAASNFTAAQISSLAPAGTSGEPINLALANPANHVGEVTLAINGVPENWILNTGTNNGNGTWTVSISDPSTLTITTAPSFSGAVLLEVDMRWVNTDGSNGSARISDNVEAYPVGSPIFAISTDDQLTASTVADLLVLAQPIANDIIHNFDVTHDKIGLIGFNGVGDFSALSIVDDADGNAIITMGTGSSIKVIGVHTADLSATNFQFNVEPRMANAGMVSISNGAILPVGGVIENSGVIALHSTGSETDLQILVESVSLQGGGHVLLSDNANNVIFGGSPNAKLINVDNTISGAGQLGAGQMTLDNHGVIIADGSHALVIDTGANIITNAGTLEATGAGGLVMESAVANTGNLWANGGDITVHGDVTGTGTGLISGSASLKLDGAAHLAVSFADNGAGTLKLGDADHFSGSIAGFGDGDTLDLTDIAFGSGTTVGYLTDTAGSGTLVISDGAITAHLALQGAYANAGFHAVQDQNGGTMLSVNATGTNQELHGSAGMDILVAGAGNDVLAGGGGHDVLFGGAGNDTFVFDSAPNGATNVATILDFKANGDADQIMLSHLAFGNLTASGGALDATQFASVADGSGGSATLDAGVHVIYDSQTGNLYYDADGANTVGGRDVLAVLGTTGHPSAVDHNDIKIG